MNSPPERLTTIISTKGQVILPKAIRDRRHWPAGTRLTVEESDEGIILRSAPMFPESGVDSVFGVLARAGPGLSLDAAVAAEATRRARD